MNFDNSPPAASSASALIGSSLLSLFAVYVCGLIALAIAYFAGFSADLVMDGVLAGSGCLAAMLSGHIPMMMLSPGNLDRLPAVMLVISGVRAVVVCAIAMALIQSGFVHPEVTAFSFFIWYAILLAIELVICAQQVRRLAEAADSSERRSVVQVSPGGSP